MLLNAFLMFCIPDLRAMAKEGVLKGDPEQIQRIVALPATLEDIVTVFGENKEALAGRFKDEERAQMYQDALSLRKFSLDNDAKRKAMQKIFLIHFVDEKEEEECVYAVSLNHVSKRVGIYFRGSVTKKDFRQDSKAIMSAIHNPVKADHLAEELGVHLGFREYLYSEEKLSKVWYNPGKGRAKELNKGQMKYQMILEQVHALLEDRPDYRLFIAGHSLGGALTTLMALEAGADEKIPKPVTAITCGAPKVGNLEFLRAFEELEQQKKLRFLQVANDRDPVTLSPPDTFNPCTPLFCKGRRYRHVGLRLKLRGSKGYVIYYPMKMRTYFGILCCDLMNLSRAWMFVIGFGFASLFCLSACFYLSIPMVRYMKCGTSRCISQYVFLLAHLLWLAFPQRNPKPSHPTQVHASPRVP